MIGGKTLNYDYYKIFYYVANYHSFTKAAHILMSSQPNMTRAVKNLERELGCTLLNRSNRTVELTPEGELLFRYAKIAVEQLQEAETKLQMNRDLHAGTISISTSEMALHCVLLPVLQRFRQRYPGVRIRIYNSAATQAMSALQNGLADLSVVTTPVSATKPLQMTPIHTFREVPICSGAFPELIGHPLPFQILAEYPLVCLKRETKTYAFYNELFLQHGLVLEPEIEAATADQILPLVKSGLGIGFVPEAFIQEEPTQQNLFVLQLEEPLPVRHVCLLKRTDVPLSIAARAMEQMLLDSAAQAPGPV